MSFIGKLNSRGGRSISNMLRRKPSFIKEISKLLHINGTKEEKKTQIKETIDELLKIKKVTADETVLNQMLNTSNPTRAIGEVRALTNMKVKYKHLEEVINGLEKQHQSDEKKLLRLDLIKQSVSNHKHTASAQHRYGSSQHQRNPNLYYNRFGRPVGGYKKLNKKSASSTKKKLSKKKSPKVHTGPRGGKYIIKRGKKIYQ